MGGVVDGDCACQQGRCALGSPRLRTPPVEDASGGPGCSECVRALSFRPRQNEQTHAGTCRRRRRGARSCSMCCPVTSPSASSHRRGVHMASRGKPFSPISAPHCFPRLPSSLIWFPWRWRRSALEQGAPAARRGSWGGFDWRDLIWSGVQPGGRPPWFRTTPCEKKIAAPATAWHPPPPRSTDARDDALALLALASKTFSGTELASLGSPDAVIAQLKTFMLGPANTADAGAAGVGLGPSEIDGERAASCLTSWVRWRAGGLSVCRCVRRGAPAPADCTRCMPGRGSES